ncbi:hypothetical protein DE146DRAFT_649443 [Phaeosphaeria sp. MPI-PUGE-AT-0046c]|nr:hypothetical protein DE146DRAFT_649443 [Phaeosphaeria sp. MPI-PUGE-AT-0046c]
MSIADTVAQCAETFRSLRSRLAAIDAPDDDDKATYSDFPNKINACFERFQLWSSSLGAHRRDKNSLDKRLREASNLQRRVLQYLKDMQGGLEDIIGIVSGKITPWDELSESSSEESDLDDDGEDETELLQLVRYVDNAISCLLRISTIIQKPAPHDRFIKSGKFDQTFRQKWDEQHVSDKFVNISEWMAIRLGKANSRRRQFLEYRKKQHEEIANLQSIEGDNKTVISSLPSAIKRNEDLQNTAGCEAARIVDDLDDRESLTSYAETVANEDALFVPAMPENAAGGSLFECPYCFLIVEGIHNRMQWKRHVYTDLQPYICLHPECISADETFARRHKWIKHDFHFHRKRWRCNMGCDTDFSSKTHVQDHFVKIHGLHGSSDHHLDALSVQVGTEVPDSLSCPLCDHELSTLKRYYKHVGQHLEQLALFVIPRDGLEEVEENLEDNDDRVSLVAGSKGKDVEEEDIEDSMEEFDVDSDSMWSFDDAAEQERNLSSDLQPPSGMLDSVRLEPTTRQHKEEVYTDEKPTEVEENTKEHTEPIETPPPKPETKSSRANQWFIPADGISRAVISADIQRYLGPDAMVRPGSGTGEYQGRPGYWITAYRSLTSQMIQDLKMDSQRWDQERPSTEPGEMLDYQDSRTHAARQHWGPTKPFDSPSHTEPYATRSPHYPYNHADPYPAYGQTPQYTSPPQARAAPGYYIASDGRQYPLSQQPQSSRQQAPISYRTPRDTYQDAPQYTSFPQAVAAPGYYIASDGRQYPLQNPPQPSGQNRQR